MHEAMARLPATPPTVGTPPGLDWHDLQSARAHGRLLHAQAMASFLASTARALGSAIGRLLRPRPDRFALLHMNDHMLADLGLRRMDVQAIAYGVIPVEQVAAPPTPALENAKVEILRPRPIAASQDRELDAAA
jgi:uncharacterized protein YjiS (DUF1127 family)